ncbi:MAG TPA: RidA family protein [Gemmatimonadales bacterium]|nr:RidA family protein [Gemmatimonadales bacterium]
MPARFLAAWAVLVTLMWGCRPSSPSGSRTAESAEYVPMAGPADLPFSALVRVGPMLYLSGQLGTDSTTHLVAGGIGPETAQALANIRALLEAHGSGMDRVVKCTAMLADMAEWGAMNQEYVRFFPTHRPARSAFGTTGLALGARIELECTALAGPA